MGGVPSQDNRLLPEDEPVHGWYRSVLSFPPHLVRAFLEEFRMGDRFLDPFVGTGTSIVEACFHGFDWSYGVDAMPFNAFIVRGKRYAGFLHTPKTWRKKIDKVISRYDEIVEDGIRSLPPAKMLLLQKDAISEMPMHRTLCLLQAIDDVLPQSLINEAVKLPIAKLLPSTIGNLRFGPEVGIGVIKEDVDVVGAWESEMERIIDDSVMVAKERGGSFTCGSPDFYAIPDDARELREVISRYSESPSMRFDNVFTSPPYPNEKDYTRAHRLEMVMLGFIDDRQSLQALKRGMLCSNTRTAYADNTDDLFVSGIFRIEDICRDIEQRRIDLGKTSGFERTYARVVRLYFGGMVRHLQAISKVLNPGAVCGYVVGDQASFLRVHIPTGRILMDLAERVGFDPIRIDLFRTRPSTVTGEDLREEVVLFRWKGR